MARTKSTEAQKQLSKDRYAEKVKSARIREREAFTERRIEVLRKANTVYLKPDREQIKQAIDKANEISGKPKNYSVNTSNYNRTRI